MPRNGPATKDRRCLRCGIPVFKGICRDCRAADPEWVRRVTHKATA